MLAIRGAIDVPDNEQRAIADCTERLLTAIVEANQLDRSRIVAAWFTSTPDLTAAYPAATARSLGWTDVALMCAQEAVVEGSLPRCIRVLVLYDAERTTPVHHCYLGQAAGLRPDLVQGDRP